MTPSHPHSSPPLTLLLLATAAVAIAGCKDRPIDDPRTEPAAVVTFKPATDSSTLREFSGIISARVQSNLGFRVSGKVIERLVDAGQTVRKDQPLMRMDPVDLELAIAVKKAELAAAKAIAARAVAEDKRQAELIKTGATSHQLFEEARATADSSQALVERLQAELKTSENSHSYTTLLADADGIVLDTLAEPGQVVQIGQTVVKLAHAGPREASVYLPETLRPAIGSTAKARLFGENTVVTARLRQLSNTADPETRTYEARYILEGVDPSSPLGATVSIKLGDSSTSLVVPNAAVTDRGKGPGVWILDRAGSQVSFRPVQVARMGEEDTVISSGLKGDEEIIALGAHLLSEGQHVRIAKKEEDSQ